MRTPRPFRPLAGLAPALAALALLSGCNYFRPTRPEVPDNRGFPANYDEPLETLETIALAIQDKSTTNGQSAYIGAFTNPTTDGQDFVAEFDPVTVARFPNGSTEWNVAKEEIFYGNLSRLQPGSQFSFVWGEFRGAPDDDELSTPAIFYRSYLLEATSDEGLTYTTVAKGNAELHMIEVRGNWKIVRWIDVEDPEADLNAGEASFGQLRLAGGL